jgi:hypothetical protein
LGFEYVLAVLSLLDVPVKVVFEVATLAQRTQPINGYIPIFGVVVKVGGGKYDFVVWTFSGGLGRTVWYSAMLAAVIGYL